MKRLRQFGVMVLLLLSCVAPMMVCMRADAQMTASERACCRMMKNRCGDMEMPASHSCCQKDLTSAQDHALQPKAVVLHPVAVFILTFLATEGWNADVAVASWIDDPQYVPPESPPSSVTILRV